MSSSERLTLILGAISAIGIPTLVTTVRAMVKWTRVEDSLQNLVKDVQQLVENKDKVHEAIYRSMADDRKATDRRLRWLEEYVWKGGGSHG